GGGRPRRGAARREAPRTAPRVRARARAVLGRGVAGGRVDGRLRRRPGAALAALHDRDLAREPRAAGLLPAGLLLREPLGLVTLAWLAAREHPDRRGVGRRLGAVPLVLDGRGSRCHDRGRRRRGAAARACAARGSEAGRADAEAEQEEDHTADDAGPQERRLDLARPGELERRGDRALAHAGREELPAPGLVGPAQARRAGAAGLLEPHVRAGGVETDDGRLGGLARGGGLLV